jgi:hypothetical protein
VSRAHCPVCDRSVVLEPTGTCPEGHLVATPTATPDRFELPWEDEPEPWVFGVEPVAAPPASQQLAPRETAEDLFRELQALIEHPRGGAASPVTTPVATPVTPPVTTPVATPVTMPVTTPTLAPAAAEPVPDPARDHDTVPASDAGGLDRLENLFDHLLEPAVRAGGLPPEQAEAIVWDAVNDLGGPTAPPGPPPTPPDVLPDAVWPGPDDRAHAPAAAPVLPVPAGSPTAGIDLGNFTARGATVGAPSRRRRFRG